MSASHPFARHVNPHLARLLEDLRLDKRFVRAQGPWLWDVRGRRYLDLIANYGAVPFGYNPPEIWQALWQVQARAEPSFVQPSFLEAAGELAERLVALAPPGLRYVTFTNSGAEAVEAAIKMARAATGRMGILAAHNSFHGKTLGALSATGRSTYQTAFGAPVPGFRFVPYGDARAVEQALQEHPGEFAAVLLEPIQGEGGIVVPPPGYLREVREITRRHGVLLVVDEIQTGLGRTGRMFACEEEGVCPDILTVAKALGGGLVPIGACLATEEAYTEEFAMKHSSTFAGGALACRAALAALERLTSDGGALLGQVRRQGERLLAGLQGLARRYPHVIREVRGRGLMLGIDFSVQPGAFAARGRDHGRLLEVMADQEMLTPVVASYLMNVEGVRVAPTLNGQSVIRIEPPLIIGEEECELALAALERAVAVLAAGETGRLLLPLTREDGEVPSVLHLPGPPPAPGAFAPPAVAVLQERQAPEQAPSANGHAGRQGLAPDAAGDGDEGRFAFVVHPLDLRNYPEFDPALEVLSEQELAYLADRFNPLLSPFVIGRTRIRSRAGRQAYGEFVVVPRTTRQLLEQPREEVLDLIRQAVELARDRGARIVGLGAYTSSVSRGGLHLADLGVALTTGNSYTVVAAMQALQEAARRLGIPVASSSAAVVGAGGAIGRATALLLAPHVQSLWLVGNPASGRRALERLEQVAHEIRHSVAPAPQLAITTDAAAALQRSQLVVVATNSADAFIEPAMLAFGAVVCDMSRPPNTSRRVQSERPDVLVIDGGVIEVPGRPDFGWNFGYERGLAYACMAETMMLALEHHYQHTSLGLDLPLETVRWMEQLAERHGFRLAELRSFDRPLGAESWQRLLAARSAQGVPAR